MKDAHPDREEAREEFVTSRQLAAVLKVSESTVRRLARDGRIPCVRLTPRLMRFNLKSVFRALDGEETPAHGRRVRRRNADGDSAEDAQLSFADLL